MQEFLFLEFDAAAYSVIAIQKACRRARSFSGKH
jgi:hypothetical protein